MTRNKVTDRKIKKKLGARYRPILVDFTDMVRPEHAS